MKTLVKREVLVAQAEADMAAYPQYKGHWNGWAVGTVTKRIKTKLCVAFEKGDVVLVDPTVRREKVAPRGRSLPYADWPEKLFRACYSFRNKADTLIDAGVVEVR